MDGKKYSISVCIITKPNENISKCLSSLKRQTYKPKEIVVHREIGRFSELRNKSILKANGEIIAFIDSDCHAEKHWLGEINDVFQDKEIVGVFGKVCYELNGVMPSISTRIISNDGAGTLTANAAFRADILKKVKFDEETNAGEDKIINKIMREKGKVVYSEDLVIFHMYQKWSFKSIINHAKKVEDALISNKKYDIPLSKWRFIVYPEHIPVLIFPPLVFLINSVRSFYDLKIAFGNYIEKVYTRLLIWKYAIKNRTFLL